MNIQFIEYCRDGDLENVKKLHKYIVLNQDYKINDCLYNHNYFDDNYGCQNYLDDLLEELCGNDKNFDVVIFLIEEYPDVMNKQKKYWNDNVSLDRICFDNALHNGCLKIATYLHFNQFAKYEVNSEYLHNNCMNLISTYKSQNDDFLTKAENMILLLDNWYPDEKLKKYLLINYINRSFFNKEDYEKIYNEYGNVELISHDIYDYCGSVDVINYFLTNGTQLIIFEEHFNKYLMFNNVDVIKHIFNLSQNNGSLHNINFTDENFLYMCCENGGQKYTKELMVCLYELFGTPTWDMYSALLMCCRRGNLELAKWIYATDKVSHVELRKNDDRIFIETCLCKRIDVITWMCEICDSYSTNTVLHHHYDEITKFSSPLEYIMMCSVIYKPIIKN